MLNIDLKTTDFVVELSPLSDFDLIKEALGVLYRELFITLHNIL